MKISLRKRIIAFMLSVILLFSGSISGFASELLESDPMAEAAAAVVSEEATEPATEAATEATETSAAIISEEITEATEAVTEEVTEPATEAVTEEATEAAAKEETVEETEEEIVEETETETVEETEESEEETEEETEETEEEKDINLQTTVNGTVIKMTGPSSSFPEGTDYSISATELTSTQENDVEVALRKMEIENETKVVSYQAYDIKLIVDGVEAQPLGEVEVTFEGGAVEEKVDGAETVEVFHIDEAAQEAQPITNEVIDSAVEMTTDHFSTYVIITTNPNGVKVTVQHRFKSGENEYNTLLYRDTVKTLKANEQLETLYVADNYNVDKVVKVTFEGETEKEVPITAEEFLTGDTIYRVYYSSKSVDVYGNVQMFDYQVKPTSGQSFNVESNYPSGSSTNNRVSAGKANQNDSTTQYDVYLNGEPVNGWYEGIPAIPGIITGINYYTGDLIMGNGLYEPGFFSVDTKPGKQILDGYRLKFNRVGDKYTLESVWENDTLRDSAGSGFYPLNHIRNSHPDSANDRNDNDFFGLRYDIQFSIGDYNGPLNYSFTGDDDMWVVLDAKENGGKVIIDLGGIHRAQKQTVDIWGVLGVTPETISEKDRAKEHTLTILYMERGAGKSNCKMEFTLPNTNIITSTIRKVDFELEIQKTVEGLTPTELEELKKNLKFVINATYKDGTAIPADELKTVPFAGTVINASELQWSSVGNSHTTEKTLTTQQNFIDDYKYTIKEESAGFEKYQLSTTVKVDDGLPSKSETAEIEFSISDLEKIVAFTNTYTPKTQNVTVKKVWKDANDVYDTRPEEISFRLKWNDGDSVGYYPNNNNPEDYTIKVDGQKNPNEWEYEVTGLPKYINGKEVSFQVEEIIDDTIAKYYSSSSVGTIMTNQYKNNKVKIVKVSSSYTNESERIPLTGAEFTLTQNGGSKTYYARSESNGYIVWYSDSSFNNSVNVFDDGTYTLNEYKAPTGYVLSEVDWTIEVLDGVLILPEGTVDNSYTAYITNTPLYELPSSGGFGIYWYMIAGTTTMMAATAVTYKNRRKEVLERTDER